VCGLLWPAGGELPGVWGGGVTPVNQTRFGQRGNCMQASVASLLDLPIDAVPDFVVIRSWWLALDELVRPRGLTPVEHRPAVPITTAGDGMLALLSGTSPRGYRHMVVGRLGLSGWEVAHDPHPEGGGIDPIDYAILFVAVDPSVPRD
jgi:hypothetical protein